MISAISKITGVLVCASFALSLCSTAEAASPTLRLSATAPIPGYAGDLDHLALDEANGRLLVAGEDKSTLEVFNLRTFEHSTVHGQVRTPHYIFVLPNAKRIVVTDASEGALISLDTETYMRKAVLPLEGGADSAAYDAKKNRLYIVTGGRAGGLAYCSLFVVDPIALKVLGRVKLPSAKAEAMALETRGHRLFVNLTDQSAVAVIDTRSLTVMDTWPIATAHENAPIALDEAGGQLFVVTRAPARVVVLDVKDGHILRTLDAPTRANGAIFDPTNKHLYVTGAEGELAVYDAGPKGGVLTRVSTETTPVGSKTAVLSRAGDTLYVVRSPGATGMDGMILQYQIQTSSSHDDHPKAAGENELQAR